MIHTSKLPPYRTLAELYLSGTLRITVHLARSQHACGYFSSLEPTRYWQEKLNNAQVDVLLITLVRRILRMVLYIVPVRCTAVCLTLS